MYLLNYSLYLNGVFDILKERLTLQTAAQLMDTQCIT